MIDHRFYKNEGPFSVRGICDQTGASCFMQGAENRYVHDVAPLEEAGPDDIACLHNAKYLTAFQETRAGFCFVAEEYASRAPEGTVCLITPSPYRAFGQVAQSFYPGVDRRYESGEALIHPTASLASDCVIEPGAVIQRGAEIGSGTCIGAQAVIGPGVKIGQDCLIESHVSVTHTLMGNRVTVLSGARLGQAGFGFFMDESGHVKVPQLGRVVIGNDVEIGANTTIDRGSLRDTVIGDGCRLDNLVQIAHNVELGKGCVVVAQVGISGSTRFGDYVVAAGQSGFAGHLKVGSGARIAAKSGIMKDIAPRETVAGYPALPVKDWHRQTVLLSRLVKDSKLKKAAS